MPEDFLKRIYLNIQTEWKIAFLSAFIIGFVTHLFVLTNMLPNHDGINNLYGDQNKSFSGRFFLQLFAGISSYFDLPLINGILGILYLSLLSVVIVEILKLQKFLSIVMVAGLIVTFPTITSVFSYMFTADGYLLSYLVTSLAILISLNNKYGFIAGAFLFYLSVGVYQVNLPFALALIILWFIKELLYSDKKLKTHLVRLAKHVVMIGFGMIAYITTFKIYQKHNTIKSYQGLNESGNVTLQDLPNQFYQIVSSFFNFFFTENLNLFEWLNIALFLLIFIGVIYMLSQRVKKIGMTKTLLIMISILLLPIFSFSLYFVSTEVKYHMLMVISLLVFYFLPIIFYDSFTKINTMTKVYSWTAVIILSLTIFNFALISNISYFNMNLKFEKSYALANRVLDRIEQLEDVDTTNKIAVLGKPHRYIESDSYHTFTQKTPIMTGVIGESLVFDSKRFSNLFNHYMGVKLKSVNREEQEKLKNNNSVKEMPVWPASDSVTIIDDVIVIKFADE